MSVCAWKLCNDSFLLFFIFYLSDVSDKYTKLLSNILKKKLLKKSGTWLDFRAIMTCDISFKAT